MSIGLDPAAAGGFARENRAKCGFAVGAGAFDVLACLQNLRDQIGKWRNGTAGDPQGAPTDEILWLLRGLAIAARTTGFNAYGCLCLHLAERIEDVHGGGRLSPQTLTPLHVWVEDSDRYIRHPSEPAAVMALIAHLNCEEWGSPFCPAEEDLLYRALLNPFS